MALSLLPLSAEDPPPNILLIVADDLGYHDLACYGHTKIRTPVLDRMAGEGLQLNHFYAGATVCTPSRMAMLTGAYPARLGWERGVIGHIMEKGFGMPSGAFTLAEALRRKNYHTGIVGKWHLGDRGNLLPHRQGFDEAFYIKRSNNQTDELWRADQRVEKPFDNAHLTETFTREAIHFIEANRGSPFFLYLPFTAPHFPVDAHPDWEGRSVYGAFGDVVEEMDHRIGEILATLEKHRLTENTLVVFLSDNGPEPLIDASKAHPFRGKKWDALEGGNRVPSLWKWPGVIPPGSQSDAVVGAIDLFPTLCRVANVSPDDLKDEVPYPIDGVDVWDIIFKPASTSGESPLESRPLLFWHGSAGFQAIRMGAWKLFPTGSTQKKSAPELYHLVNDPGEQTNVASEHPDRVRRLKNQAQLLLQDIEARSLPLERDGER